MPISENAVLVFGSSGAVVNDAGTNVTLLATVTDLWRCWPVGFVLGNSAVVGVQRDAATAADKGRVVSWDTSTGVMSVVGRAYTNPSAAGTDATVTALDKNTGKFVVIPLTSARAAIAGVTALVYDPATNTTQSTPVSISGAQWADFSPDGSKLAVAYSSYSGGTTPAKPVRVYNTSDWSEVTIPHPNTWNASLAAVTECASVSWSADGAHMGFGFSANFRVYICPYGDWSNPQMNQSRASGDNYHFVWAPDNSKVVEAYASGGASSTVVRSWPALTTIRSYDAATSRGQVGFLPDSNQMACGRDYNGLYAGYKSFLTTVSDGLTVRAYAPDNGQVRTAMASRSAFWTNYRNTTETI